MTLCKYNQYQFSPVFEPISPSQWCVSYGVPYFLPHSSPFMKYFISSDSILLINSVYYNTGSALKHNYVNLAKTVLQLVWHYIMLNQFYKTIKSCNFV